MPDVRSIQDQAPTEEDQPPTTLAKIADVACGDSILHKLWEPHPTSTESASCCLFFVDLFASVSATTILADTNTKAGVGGSPRTEPAFLIVPDDLCSVLTSWGRGDEGWGRGGPGWGGPGWGGPGWGHGGGGWGHGGGGWGRGGHGRW